MRFVRTSVRRFAGPFDGDAATRRERRAPKKKKIADVVLHDTCCAAARLALGCRESVRTARGCGRRRRARAVGFVMSQCCVCMEATGEKSVVRVALVHRGRGPAGRGPPSPHPRLGQAVGPLGARDGETRTRRPLTTRPSPVPSSSGAHQLRPRVPPVLRAPMVPAQGDGLPPHAPCPKCKAPYDMGQTVTIYLDVPRRAAADTPTPPARVKTRGGGVRLPLASPSDPDGTIVVDSPDGAGTSGRICDPEDPSALAGLLPSEVASRCVALGERVAALREETRALAAEANDARRRAREAEDAAAAAELATDDADALREELAGTKHELHLAIHQRDAAAFSERTCKAKTLRAQEELSERQNELQRLRGRSRRSRRSVNSSATSPRAASSAGRISSVDFVARSPPTRDARWRRSVAASPGKTDNCTSKWRSTTSWRRGCARRNARSPPRRWRRRRPGRIASRITRGRGRGNRPRPAISPVARVRSADAPRAGGVATTTTRGTPRTRLCFLARGRRRPNARDATRISPTSRTSPSRRREETPSRWRGSRRGGHGRAAQSRCARAWRRIRTRVRVRVASFGIVVERRRGGPGENLLDDILEEIDAKTNAKTSANDTSASASHANGASASASRPSTLRVPAGAASFARRGVGGGVGDDARASSNPAGDARDGKSSFTAQTVAAVAQRWFDRAGRASSRGAPLCDARDDARRAERTRVD